jgi:NADH-quinone oxidoreductase subunit G
MAEASNLIKLTINGKAVEVPKGTTVFEAAAKSGTFIPHYCYHPDLSIAGVCRMCMVEIEGQPKMQISCNLPAAEGMVVRTDTAKVKDTVKNVLELHLINHPLDCPICDKAGECKLQDFYRDYGLYKSRMDRDDKVHKPKVVDIGTIVLDAERCILCTRCVRFTDEVTKTHELAIQNRGDRAELGTYDGKPLRNDYTGNLADICPVGALTAKDFRFRQRVWFLEKEETVCTRCAQGCNTVASVNPRTKKLFRVEPRRNPEVNKSWICDTGRWDYHYVYEKRISEPLLRERGKTTSATWHAAFQEMHGQVVANAGRVLVGLSTQLTNEELFDLVTQLKALGVTQLTWLVDEAVVRERKPYDGILQHKDRTPNAAGFERLLAALGVPWMEQSPAKEKLRRGDFDALWLLGLEGYEPAGVENLLSATPESTVVVGLATSFGKWLDRCRWVLPYATAFERSGTVVNASGRLQRLQASLPWQQSARDGHALALGVTRGDDRTPLEDFRGPKLVPETTKLLAGTAVEFGKLDPMGLQLGGK